MVLTLPHKKAFLDDFVTTVQIEEMPAELIINWAQTGIRLVSASSSMIKQKEGGNGD